MKKSKRKKGIMEEKEGKQGRREEGKKENKTHGSEQLNHGLRGKPVQFSTLGHQRRVFLICQFVRHVLGSMTRHRDETHFSCVTSCLSQSAATLFKLVFLPSAPLVESLDLVHHLLVFVILL